MATRQPRQCLGANRRSYQRANLELAAFGDMKYMRTLYNRQYFLPLFNNFATLALNGEIDYGRGFVVNLSLFLKIGMPEV